MSFIDSILIAIFCITVVFVVLGTLGVIIRLFSLLIQAIEKQHSISSGNLNSKNK